MGGSGNGRLVRERSLARFESAGHRAPPSPADLVQVGTHSTAQGTASSVTLFAEVLPDSLGGVADRFHRLPEGVMRDLEFLGPVTHLVRFGGVDPLAVGVAGLAL